MKKRAIFLDRDDTLIRNVPYLGDPRQVEVLPGVSGGLARLRKAGFLLLVVSNQSGVGRGWLTLEQVEAVNRAMETQLGMPLDGYYLATGAPGDDERKPSPRLVERAVREWDLDLAGSWLIGDRWSDVACGRRAGCRAVLVAGGTCDSVEEALRARAEADYCVGDFQAAVELILGGGSGK